MADDQTQTVDPSDQTNALVQQLLRQTLTGQSMQPTPEPPHSGDNRTWGSLLGQALVGGAGPGSTDAQNEQAGLRALQSVGLGMMSGSDYSQQRHSLGSIIANAVGGAQESNAAQIAAQQQYAQKAQEMQLARIKEALPLLTLQQQLASAAASRKLLGGSTPTTIAGAGTGGIGAVGGDTYEGAIAGHEGTGQNPNSSAAGTGQFLASTWQGFANANPDLFKGMSPQQVLDARNNPALGAQAITWLAQQNADQLNKAGVTPSGTSLGIAHYLGAGAAAKVMQAQDNAPVSGFVSDAAVKANPELATMTVGQLKQRYANTPAPAFLGGPKPGAAPVVAGAPQTPPAASTAAQALPVPPIPPASPSAPAQTAFVPGANLPYGAPGPAPTAPQAPLVPPVAPTPRTATTLRGTGTPAAPQLPGGNQQLSEGEPVPAPYRIAGTDTGAPASSFGIIGQAARAAEEGRPPPTPQAATPQQPAQPQPPPQYPDVVQGDVITRHPGSYADFAAKEMVPTPQTEDFNPNLTAAQQAAFAARAQGIQAQTRHLDTLNPIDQPKASAEIDAAKSALAADMQTAAQEKAQKAAEARTKFEDAQRAAVQTRYDAAVAGYRTAAQGKATFNQDIVKSQAEKQDAANQKMVEPYATGATQAQQILGNIDLAKQVLPGLPQNAAPWLASETNRARLAPLEQYMPANWREAVQSADTFQQVMGGMVSAMGANVVSGQPGGRESAYDQFKSMLPTLSQSAEGRERALMFMEELAKRRIAEADFMQSYMMDPKNRDPEMKVANMSGARSAMNAALGPMVRLPPSRYDPNAPGNTDEGRAQTKTYMDYFNRLPDNARYVSYGQAEDGRYHPVVRVKAPGQTRPEIGLE